MYKKIMVPLDGSKLAECVLPHVEGFITGFQVSSIAFVRVIEPSPTRFDDTASLSSISRDKMIETTKKIEEQRKSNAAEYLEGAAGRLKHEGVVLETEVLIGRVADTLAEYTETNGVDLIIIATHGRSGISRWVRGSIADRVLRFSRVPVFMIPADDTMIKKKV